MKNNIKTYIIVGSTMILGIFIGASLFSSESQNEANDQVQLQESADTSAYTCSMHPQIRQEESGDCPICGMELIPASSMKDHIDPDAIKMSKTARQLAGLETMVVGSQTQDPGLEFSGRLAINQNLTQTLTANFNLRIETLYVNDEGEKVNKGQVIAELYAPDIQVIKEEWNLAKRQQNEQLLNSIKQKIKNYELSVSDVESLNQGKLKLRAPRSGYITELMVQQGDNLKAGQNFMRIADLSSLWAMVDVYENDLGKINIGDKLSIQTSNQQNIQGKITFISPILDDNSRSAQARVVIDNTDQQLKPGVFIKAKLSVEKENATSSKSLMIPKSAVLWTGKRSVVYQQLENENGVYFKMKEVETGPSSAAFVEVLSGLNADDKIVTHGASSIDSEAQLANKPSMMNPDDISLNTRLDDHNESKTKEIAAENEVKEMANDPETVKDLISVYNKLKNALVLDDFETSKRHYKKVIALLAKLSIKKFKDIEELSSIKELRKEFIVVSGEVIRIVKTTNSLDKTIFIQRCPMADSGEGARWLSFSDQIRNPYYGASMLKCGSVVDSIP
ncbi:efflux RND transporter periplasmic adaptor subunit [Mesohalobacter halotolerans]|uniref:Efflux RND transporter periplasmic adaptor subunit n=1 Tax=Mesohalobacter halotolerans TaxID=1883405 RepID=A0A4U5TT44_9FLAO|nr:efflux RND transporter periplasmic adaptor subunit [Mesohalobacter halotolerans]TKS56644.1 efflux RND transporter periplasmic adaptor subunit [Mesohalobacter halotolerans]